MRITIVLLFALLMVSGGSYAQSKKNKNNTNSQKNKPNAFSPYSAEDMKSPAMSSKKAGKRNKKNKSSFNLTFDKKIEEFEQRMIANAKKYKKAEKEMQKPQYSDPSYFGHKKKPKKRPPGKRKFCKECGIVH